MTIFRRTYALIPALVACLSLYAAETREIALKGTIARRFDITVTNNFMKLDLERDFFAPFRLKKNVSGFIGLGKLADAAVYFAKHSSDPAVHARKNEIISFIIDNQLEDGYTGYFAPEARMKKLWDLHEIGFIIQGLVSEWELFGNRKALEAAKRNVDYVLRNWKSMPGNWEFSLITDRETTLGLGFGIARLYVATRDKRYLDFLRNERSLDLWDDPIVVGRDKMIYGQAYGYLGTCLEQLELYALDPAERYLRTSRRALDFMTEGDGLLINGTGGIAECWTNDQDGEGSAGETCLITFQLLFYDTLIRLGVGDKAQLGDMMERVVYNALFAAQSRDGRRLRYYTPLNGDRKFFARDVYCCPNNFRRAVSRLPEYVFYTEKNRVIANLYTPCEASFKVGGNDLSVKEETDYPSDGRVRFTLNPETPTAFTFSLRLPNWCTEPLVRINGEKVTYKYRPGQILNLPRVWKSGDVVEADFPMEVRTIRGRKRQSGRFAVMRGPVVYALNTHSVEAFRDMHPYDAQTILMMDPKRLVYRDGLIHAVISTVDYAVGIADFSVDNKPPKNVSRVQLMPFEDEDCTLTYFRAPDIETDVRDEDELFGPAAKRPWKE